MTAAAAGELPAVSGPNGRLSVEGGSSADEGEGVATGSFALPLGHALLTLDDNHRFGQAEVAYYITDAFKVYAGYRYINETSFGAAGSEYLIRGMDVPVALFARGDFGDEDFNSITGGLRVYLSDDPQKSLIDRHRRDDPKVYAPTFPTLAANNPTQVPQCTVNGFTKSPLPRTATASVPPGLSRE